MAECMTTVLRAIGRFLTACVRCRGTAPSDDVDTTRKANANGGLHIEGVVLHDVVQSRDEINTKKARDETDEIPNEEIDAEVTEDETDRDPETAELEEDEMDFYVEL